MLQDFIEVPAGEVIDLSHPSICGLAYLLRHKELWPEGFEFDYMQCHTCAMGLAFKVWPGEIRTPSPTVVGTVLGLSARDAEQIFTRGGVFSGFRPPPTADCVADMLDEVA